MALAGDKYYHAMTTKQIERARQGEWKIRVTPTKPVPREWLEPVVGKSILCLAGGGGQQAPILSALGGSVTVYDLSPQQLLRDKQIAEREGLSIETKCGDMRDLSKFNEGQFDLIVSPCATCFCPTVKEIWDESFRVLKPGGSLIVGFINPIYYLFDAAKMDRDEFEVRHCIPYCDFDLPAEEREKLIGPDRPLEFGHSLENLLGQQIEAGFSLTGFYEDGWGGSDKLSSLINLFIATRATKPLDR
jgi:SAM-dependent methyltransferase